MKKRSPSRIRILAAILLCVPACFPQSRPNIQRSAPARPRPPFLQQATVFEETSSVPYVTKLVLQNGLTILVEEFKSKPVVSIQTYIRVGSLNESPQNRGAARLIPSLVCRKPVDKIAGALEQNIYALGGLLRSTVGYENTRFEIVAPSAQWKRALNLQAEALRNPSFETGDWTPEAKLLVNEAWSALDDPEELSREKLLELAYEPVRMEKNGDIAEGGWQGLKSDDLAGFFKTFYVPSKMTVVLSGDVIASEVLNEIVRTYGKFASATKAEPALPKASPAGFRYRLLRGDVSVPQVLFGFRATPENASDSRALEVLRAVLGLGEGSALNFRLRDQDHLIWSEDTGIFGSRNFKCFLIRAEMDPKDIDRAQIAVLTEIELLKRQEPEAAEVARAVAQLELEYWKHLDTVTGRAESLAQYDALGDWKGRDRYVSDMKKVSPADITRAARKYLRIENLALIELLPAEGLEQRNPTAEGIRSTLEGLLSPATDQVQEKREKETLPYLKIPKDSGGFKFSEVQNSFQVASILRGPEMYIREDHTAPVLTMGFFFAGGKFAENNNNAGLTKLMTDLIARGTPDMQAGRFYQQLEVYGGKIEPVVTDDYFGFNFSILSGNFEAGFDLLRQAVKSPVFSKEDVGRQKEMQIREIRRRKASQANALDLENAALFQGFSYSRNTLGTEDSLAGFTPNTLEEWYREYIRNRKPFVVIIGDTRGTSLAAQFVKEFSGSRMQDSKIPETWVKALSAGESVEQRWKDNQSMILVGFQAPPVDDEDAYTVAALEELAGNSSSLSQEIRYKLGAADRVSVVYEPRLRGGSLIVAATTRPGNEEAVLKAVRDELLRIAAGPVSYKDCRSAIVAAVGMYGILNEERTDEVHHVVSNLLAGKGISGFQNYPASVQSVTETDLTEIAQRIFDMKKAVIVKMHGRSN
ncbi:MAG TPA: pitrilysin family protein [Acidobacteriota bacterium]|nr:pitrilysin family protein [Acidobacteriota bacterium]